MSEIRNDSSNFERERSLDSVPLCVDLDGTLIRTDVLWESVIQLWRYPLTALRALIALLLHGKAAFKAVLAECCVINPVTLPYREDLLDFIRREHAAGRELVLATATHVRHANEIAEHLDLFVNVFATDGKTNLSGVQKCALLESVYGVGRFDYIGDSNKDIPLFNRGRSALLVNPSRRLREKVEPPTKVLKVFSDKPFDLRDFTKALRLHQWVKNLLLAVPLLSAHLVADTRAWANIAMAFLSFGLVASSTYLLNDLVDLQSDRSHTKKKFRPLASGRMSIPTGLLLLFLLAAIGWTTALTTLPEAFILCLALYVALTLAYSFSLKRKLMVDVLALAILYTLRILAGGAAIGVIVSEWLLMFSLFMFLSLAFLKRAIELMETKSSDRVAGRGYLPTDLETVRTLGIGSGLISILVFSLYVNSPAVAQLYRSPGVLWLICPLLIYWIARIWFLAARGGVHYDPVVFALFDWQSYWVGICGAIVAYFATTGVAL